MTKSAGPSALSGSGDSSVQLHDIGKPKTINDENDIEQAKSEDSEMHEMLKGIDNFSLLLEYGVDVTQAMYRVA